MRSAAGTPSALLVVCAMCVSTVSAYHGGPIRASLWGLDESTDRFYFELRAYDEMMPEPEVFCFDLASDEPGRAHRVEEIDERHTPTGRVERSPKRRGIAIRCRRPTPMPDFDLRLSVDSDSVGVDSEYNVPVLAHRVRVEVA